MCTPAARAILLQLLTHALQAPIRVTIRGERIPTHPEIKVKLGNQSKAVHSHEKSGN